MTSNSAENRFETIQDWEVLRLAEVDSTNSFLMREREQLLHPGRVVLAETQTRGRGRLARTYVSLPGRHLTFSVVLHLDMPLSKVQGVALLAGLAVSRVLEKRIKGVRLKWPNDVLVHSRKICGILLETTKVEKIHYPVLILGIGLNTEGCADEFPMELQGTLTTLEEEYGFVVNREIIFQELLSELKGILEEFREKGIEVLLQEWLRRSDVLGKRVRCLNGNMIEGTFDKLSPDGFPLILKDDGTNYIHVSGDLVVIG